MIIVFRKKFLMNKYFENFNDKNNNGMSSYQRYEFKRKNKKKPYIYESINNNQIDKIQKK